MYYYDGFYNYVPCNNLYLPTEFIPNYERYYYPEINYPIQYVYPDYSTYEQIPQKYQNSHFGRGPVENPSVLVPDDKSEGLRADPVVLINYWAEKNPNFRRRCGCDSFGSCPSTNHGTSYVAVDYNHRKGPGKYNIRVWIKHYGKEYYGRWNTFEERWRKFQNAPRSYTHFTSAILSGPNASGRQNYFRNGHNDTPGLRTGTLGLEVYDKRTGRSVWRALYYFDSGFGSFGREWLRCGHDYGFQFEDS